MDSSYIHWIDGTIIIVYKVDSWSKIDEKGSPSGGRIVWEDGNFIKTMTVHPIRMEVSLNHIQITKVTIDHAKDQIRRA